MDGFVMAFKFEHDFPNINATLNIVKKKIFEYEVLVIWKPDWVV